MKKKANNLVAKNIQKGNNRPAIHEDRKKAVKRGKTKYKHTEE